MKKASAACTEMEANPNTPLIAVRASGETLTVSSLDIATDLGIQHKNLLDTLRTYQPAIEKKLGLIAFETRKINSPTGKGRPDRIAHLTEDQALALGTLSRNSERVVDFKLRLVISFSEARRRIREVIQAPSVSNQLLQQQEQRIAKLEQQLERMIEAQQQAARSLLELPRSTEQLPEETTRIKVQRIVNGYCRAEKVKQQQVWRRVYDRLYYLYRINIRAHKRSERESWLDVADRKGYMDKLYAIVSAELIFNPDPEE